MNGHNRDFRRLRRRLDSLERAVYETDSMIQYARRDNADPNREERIANYYTENAERQEEIDEINYVLDVLAPRNARSAWPAELKIALIVFISIVFVLAMLATSRAL